MHNIGLTTDILKKRLARKYYAQFWLKFVSGFVVKFNLEMDGGETNIEYIVAY